MPITKRPEGSYQVTVCYGGRTVRRSSKSWTRDDAKRIEGELYAQLKASAVGRAGEPLIAEALEKWLLEHVPRLKSERQTRNHARRLLPFIAGRTLQQIPAVWSEVKAAMPGKAPATINHVGRILRQLSLTAWREWQWISSPPAIRLLTETPRERFLERTQVEALAKAMPTKEGSNCVLFAAYTGIRRGHMLKLTAHDIRDGRIWLDRSGKTKRLQVIPLHPKVKKIPLPLGLTDWSLTQEWNAAREATGIDCRWHDLRHTCASWLVQAGVPLLTVKEFLGHSTIAMTQRYAHLAPSHLDDAIAKVA